MITIVGAGLAGLLAASMLSRRDSVTVVESQPALPNNHSALLRFRSPIVGEVLGIPFKKVRVIKSYAPWLNPVADTLAYSYKNLGAFRSDRSIGFSTDIVDRWIAPPDLVQRMYDTAIKSGVRFFFDYSYLFSEDGPTISTIPMYRLMGILQYPIPHPAFGYRAGVNVHATIEDCDAYVSLAVPSPELPFSRVSITGEQLIVEVPSNVHFTLADVSRVVNEASKLLGIDRSRVHNITWSAQKYAKIVPINEEDRRKFIFWASTVQNRSYSLGRFATWRPGLLLDDVVNDVRVIERLMDSPHKGYAAQQMEIKR